MDFQTACITVGAAMMVVGGVGAWRACRALCYWYLRDLDDLV